MRKSSVDQQCCPSGNCPETHQRPTTEGLWIFWLNHMLVCAKPWSLQKISFLALIRPFVGQPVFRLKDLLKVPPSCQTKIAKHCFEIDILVNFSIQESKF